MNREYYTPPQPNEVFNTEFRVKIVFLGESGVGKTCLTRYQSVVSVDLTEIEKTRSNPFKSQKKPSFKRAPMVQLPTVDLAQLIRLQLVDGSWRYEEVSKVLNKDLRKNMHTAFKSIDVWATAIALAYLLKNGAGNDEKYSLIIQKAKNVVATIPDAESLASAWLRNS